MTSQPIPMFHHAPFRYSPPANCASTGSRGPAKLALSREGNRELDLGGRPYWFRRCGTATAGTKPTTVPVSATLRRFVGAISRYVPRSRKCRHLRGIQRADGHSPSFGEALRASKSEKSDASGSEVGRVAIRQLSVSRPTPPQFQLCPPNLLAAAPPNPRR